MLSNNKVENEKEGFNYWGVGGGGGGVTLKK